MLLNEFLKERKRVEDQQETIAQLKSDATKQEAVRIKLKSTVLQQQKAMEILMAQLTEQAAQIERVSAQLELSKAARQTVLNNQQSCRAHDRVNLQENTGSSKPMEDFIRQFTGSRSVGNGDPCGVGDQKSEVRRQK